MFYNVKRSKIAILMENITNKHKGVSMISPLGFS